MRNGFSKIALAAGIGLALVFTFSCGNHTTEDDNLVGNSSLSSSSYGDVDIQSSSSNKITGNSSSSRSISSSSGGVVTPSSSSSKSSSSSQIGSVVERGTFMDIRDNTEYDWVKIGEQIWMAKNLEYEAPGSKCYDNSAANCAIYGRLYDWVMAMNNCPDGWHLPSDGEWTTLTNYIGNDAGMKLKATTEGWASDALGTDNYGFKALPSGYVGSDNSFGGKGTKATWWSNTYEYNAIYTTRNIDAGNGIYKNGSSDNEKDYYSVRCIKGEPERPTVERSSFVDTRDNIEYKAVKIGSQRWMAENLKYNAPGSKCYDNSVTNCNIYGRLYQWEMATAMKVPASSSENPSGVKGICPTGWHIPSNGEWTTLTNYIGNFGGLKLKAKDGWNGYNNGLDSYGFTALPSGYVGSDNSFGEIGINTYWWSTTRGQYGDNYIIRLLDIGSGMNTTSNCMNGSCRNENDYISVRCVEDIEMP